MKKNQNFIWRILGIILFSFTGFMHYYYPANTLMFWIILAILMAAFILLGNILTRKRSN
jgi:hypothetical protein